MRGLIIAMLAVVAVAGGCAHTGTRLRPSSTSEKTCQVGPVTALAGTFCGLQQQVGTSPRTVNAFLGIPFAEPVSGAMRWTNPVAKAPLGKFDATAFGPICPQDTSWGGRIGGLRQDEDCLSLNVWTPPGAPPAGGFPVMAYIYGGAFVHGSNADPLLSGASLAASQDVVVVSANYRIGALGFMAGKVGDATFAGNYAILDQQLALKWVQTNIAAFGGNADNVTIFGESAGAISVGLHLLSVPSSAPLFKAAIIESDPLGVPVKSAAHAQAVMDAFAKALHCDTSPDPRKCLQAIPPGSLSQAGTIIAAQQSSEVLGTVSLDLGLETFIAWAPYLDGTLVTQLPIAGAMKGTLNKPTIIGTNRDEADVFLSAVSDSVFQRDCYVQLIKFAFGADGTAILARPAYAAKSNPTANKKTFIDLLGARLFTCADQAAARQARLVPLYAYHFIHHSDWQSNTLFAGIPECGEAEASCHEAELPYVFDTPGALVDPPHPPSRFTPEEAALSEAMQVYWANFAKNQDPNVGKPVPVAWPKFTTQKPLAQYLVLNTSPSVGLALPGSYECSFWDRIGYGPPEIGRPPASCKSR